MSRIPERVKQAIFLLLFSLLAGGIYSKGAFAARVINSVTLNGASSVTVAAGSQINVVVTATISGSGQDKYWFTTGWRLGSTPPGTVTCINHDTSGSQSFSITAPVAAGLLSSHNPLSPIR